MEGSQLDQFGCFPLDGKIQVVCIWHLTLVMIPHNLGVSVKEVFPEHRWEEIGWHHESWKWKGN
jgi:hypothetical protein